MKTLNMIVTRSLPFLWFANFVAYVWQKDIPSALMALLLTIYSARDFE